MNDINEQDDNNDVEELDNTQVPLEVYHVEKEVEQRGRKVKYRLFTADADGLTQLINVVGAAALVNRYQEFYVARNSLLSLMDKEDKGDFTGERKLPLKAKEGEVKPELYFDLTRNFPKPGSRRTKWGELKPYVEQAKNLLDANSKSEAFKEKQKELFYEQSEYLPEDDDTDWVAFFEKAQAEETGDARIRVVAGRLKEVAEKAKDNLLG